MKAFRLLFLTALLLSLSLASWAGTYNNFSSFQAATSSLVHINFDTLPDGSAAPGSGDIGGSYAAWGINFDPGNQFSSSFIQPTSSPNGWLSNNGLPDALFEASFTASNITAVGVYNVLNGGLPSGSLLQAYDSSSTLLGSVWSDADGTTLDFFGLTTSAPIAYFTVTVPGATGWGLDDLYFGQAGTPTPEPASLVLLACGLLGLGSLKKRK